MIGWVRQRQRYVVAHGGGWRTTRKFSSRADSEEHSHRRLQHLGVTELLTMWRATRGPVTPMLLVDTYEATLPAEHQRTVTSWQPADAPRVCLAVGDYNRVNHELVLRNLGRGRLGREALRHGCLAKPNVAVAHLLHRVARWRHPTISYWYSTVALPYLETINSRGAGAHPEIGPLDRSFGVERGG